MNKIDFMAIIEVNHANCNGDPLNGNMPRTTYDGLGEISDVCIKRKMRNRLLDMGESVFVQSDDKKTDEYVSLRERAEANEAFSVECKKGKKADRDTAIAIACEEWFDVRAFGQVFAFKNSELSIGVRGAVSIHPAFSLDVVDITSTQIVKSVNSETTDGGKASDTMGMKHRVDFGVYVLKGSINSELAEKNGFDAEDAAKIKEALCTLFMNDSSSARPDGSMSIHKVFWWEHNCKIGQYSSKRVFDTVVIGKKEGVIAPRSMDDYEVKVNSFSDLEPEVIDGL